MSRLLKTNTDSPVKFVMTKFYCIELIPIERSMPEKGMGVVRKLSN